MKVFVTISDIKLNSFEQLVLTVAKGVLQTHYRLDAIKGDKEIYIYRLHGLVYLNIPNTYKSIGEDIIELLNPFLLSIPLELRTDEKGILLVWQRFKYTKSSITVHYPKAEIIP